MNMKVESIESKMFKPNQVVSNENGLTENRNLTSVIKKQNELKKQEIKNLLKYRLYNSLAQVILKIILTPHLILKLFLLSFVIFSTTLTSYLVIESILAYFEYGVTTMLRVTTRTVYERPTLYPKVTFCNWNEFQTEYAFNQTELESWDGAYSTDDERKKLGHDLNDILISCSFNDHLCTPQDFTWSYNVEWSNRFNNFGNCYTFDSDGGNVDPRKTDLPGFEYDLRLELYVNIYEELIYVEKQTYGFSAMIHIGYSNLSTYHYGSGTSVSAGSITNIVVDREFKTILPEPYSNCKIDSNAPKFIQGLDLYNLIVQSNYEYTQQLCFYQCYQEYLFKKYNCINPYFLSLINATKCIIDIPWFNSTFVNDNCISICPLEC